MKDNRTMRRQRPATALVSPARNGSRMGALIAVLACLAACATVPQDEYDLVVAERTQLQEEADALSEELSTREARISSLETALEEAQTAAATGDERVAELEGDLEVVLRQLGETREDRLELQDQIDDLERQIERIGSAAVAAQQAEETTIAEEAAGLADLSAPDALAAAIQGGGGFTRVSSLGLRDDVRARSRLAIASPGIGVDSTFSTPVLHDTRLDYEETILYLTIIDPQGRRPRLELTAQYTTEIEPLYLRTAFVTIDGGDPVDPIDPIVLAGEPVRQTDGTVLREAIAVDADRSLVSRLSTMVSSDQFRVTYVGLNRQITHQPSVAERAALSNILFAFIDLGGL